MSAINVETEQARSGPKGRGLGMYFLLLSAQTVGIILLLGNLIPLHRLMSLDFVNYKPDPRSWWAITGVLVIQAAYWLRVLLGTPLPGRGNIVLGHVLLFASRLTFVTVTAASVADSGQDHPTTHTTSHSMPTPSPTPPEAIARKETPAARCGVAPSITLTDNARSYIRDKMERMTLPVKGIRVHASPRSVLRLDYAIRFVPAEEPPCPTDTIIPIDDINVFIDKKSAPHLKGATIDYIFRIVGSELKVLVSFEHIDTPEGRLATKVQRVIDEQINPSLGTHGGAATLIDIEGDVLFIELTGGCQGCSMADSTMKQGIETAILQDVPEVREIRDVTDHANGTNPYFR